MEQKPENKMGTMAINPLLIQVALPIIISMTIQGLYNVVDSIFVARINEEALNAVSLAFPVQNMMISVAVGLSVGMNAVLSRSLGEKNFKKVSDVAMHGLFLTAITSFLTLLFGLFGVKSFFAGQTNIPEILAYGEEYLLICCSFAFTLYFTITCERMLQATGRTTYTMIAQGVGAVVNIVLDPIFIFGLLGFPRMEVRGAAIATVVGQTISMVLNLYFNWKHNSEISYDLKEFRPSIPLIKEIGAIALPTMAVGSTASVLVYYLNQILLTFSATATAVLGVYYKLQSFVFMPVYGLNNGLIPILAYNFGAKNHQRFTTAMKLGLAYAVGIMCLGTLLFQLFPEPLFRLFQEENAEGEMLTMGVSAVKIISFSFPVVAISIMASCVFQALGHGLLSLLATVLRQVVIQLPCAYISAQYFGLTAVWYSFLVAETLAGLCVGVIFMKIYHKEILPMKKQDRLPLP